MASPFVEFHGISKSFGGVQALRDVSLAIEKGQCHALMGENGAGKSTLAKALAGIHRPDSGTIAIDGRAARIHTPADAAALGIGMVHQELAFCPDLSVAENMALGRYPRRLGLFVDRPAMRQRAAELLAQVGSTIDPSRLMRALSTAQEQLVQIASAIGAGARILVFDEPTASLSERESRQLFSLIAALKARGVTMIYVSHRMPEVFALCDAISVLRDGQFAGTLQRETAAPWPETARDQVVRMMIGRPLAEYLPPPAAAPLSPDEDFALETKNLSSPGKFREISFGIRAGEIVGFAGLVGSGRSEVAKAIFGLDRRVTGEIRVAGRRLAPGSVQRAMKRGIGLVPEDRKRQGLVLMMSGRENFSLPLLDRLSRLGFLDHGRERRRTLEFFSRLHVKTASIGDAVSSMSGGNQQKVVIAKWLARGGRILIVDEPTRGVDVGAKSAIHHLLGELAAQGIAVLVISSELPEVLGICGRILIMREGRLVGEMERAEATQENVLRLMAGVGEAAVLGQGTGPE